MSGYLLEYVVLERKLLISSGKLSNDSVCFFPPPSSDKYQEREDYVDEARAMDDSYYNRLQARPKYNYLDRDLQLPVQLHQNVQSYRDSPDEGKTIDLHFPELMDYWILLLSSYSRNIDSEVSWEQH